MNGIRWRVRVLCCLSLALVFAFSGSTAAGQRPSTDELILPEPKPKPKPKPEPKPKPAGPVAGEECEFDGVKFVWIPPGTFTMGSSLTAEQVHSRYGGELEWYKDERPQHKVTLTSGFWLGKYEVTNEQFRAFVNATGHETDAEKQGYAYGVDGSGNWGKRNGYHWNNPGWPVRETHPVVCVSWNDAQAYIKWLNGKGARTYRLPSEAEWEYACRAGTATPFTWGYDATSGAGWLNAADLTAKERFSGWTTFNFEDGFVFTASVGSFRANAWGLCDILGNVWEWCEDWYDENYYTGDAQRNPRNSTAGSSRVVRGGSWNNNPGHCRAANRHSHNPAYAHSLIGFRICCVASAR